MRPIPVCTSSHTNRVPASRHKRCTPLRYPSGAICTLSLSFNNKGPQGTFFRYICDNGTFVAYYDDLIDGEQNKIDLSKVDVSMNGIELQDREFFAAIKEKRTPNADLAQCYTAMETLDKLDHILSKSLQTAAH